MFPEAMTWLILTTAIKKHESRYEKTPSPIDLFAPVDLVLTHATICRMRREKVEDTVSAGEPSFYYRRSNAICICLRGELAACHIDGGAGDKARHR